MDASELTLANMPLVKSIAIRFWRRRPSLSYDDLLQVGAMGLFKAARKYLAEPRCGAFSTIAYHYVRGAMLDYLRSEVELIRIPEHVSGDRRAKLRKLLRAGRLATARGRRGHERPEGAAEKEDEKARRAFADVDDRDEIECLLPLLNENHRHVVEGFLAGKTRGEIAREKGITRQRIWAIGKTVFEQHRARRKKEAMTCQRGQR